MPSFAPVKLAACGRRPESVACRRDAGPQAFRRRACLVRLRDAGDFDIDVLVIGSGPGGQKAAIAAAKDDITIGDLTARTRHVVGRENDVVRSQLTRNRVTILTGTGCFLSPTVVDVAGVTGRGRAVSARAASASRPTPPCIRPGGRA
ncbi:MAG: hypothetical protein WBH47_11415 [Streptosporangiaceae bacterium]